MRNQMKEAISDAFFELAQKKSIDKITVKDLVEYCDISRQTFYYHFQDIYEVIEWKSQQIEQDYSRRAQAADSFEGAIRIMAASFVNHYDLMTKLRDSQMRDFVERLVMDSMQERLRQAVRESVSDKPLEIAASEIDALISFFSYGLAGLMFSRGRNRKPDEEELAQQILAVFRYLVPGMDSAI